jgi:hypothetical protein
MKFDANDIKNINKSLPEYSVCIIGAGAAGITLATELGKRGYKIALMEAGGEEYSEKSQNSYKGKVLGDPYFDLDITRLRYFGGSTNHWQGWCRSFEKIDFERDYLDEHYSWPINKKDISSYLDEACKILEIENNFEEENLDNINQIKKINFQFSPPVLFGPKYYNFFQNSENVDLFLNSNLIEIEGTKTKVKSAIFSNYSGDKININAKIFVFAMGGLENSRFLLWFSEKYGNKFFDNSTPIGKYWMEHPHFRLGEAIVEKKFSKHMFYSTENKAQKNNGIMGCGFRLIMYPHSELKKKIIQLMCVAPKLGKKIAELAEKNLLCSVQFRAAWEQAPNVKNKITLGDSKDQFGIPRINLNWKKRKLDRQTIKKSAEFFNDWLIKNDNGRIRLDSWLLKNEDYPPDDELGGHHHMGGTRMFKNNKYGVVDANCKLYGSQNMFAAGSSIFTTGGHNNPTLPILQFTLRLRDHLISIL